MKKFSVVSHLVRINVDLDWPIYDRRGTLMMEKGERVSNREQLSAMRQRGIYRLTENTPDAALGAVHLLHDIRYTTIHPLHIPARYFCTAG